MASLEALTKSYRAKKAQVAKLRRKSEINLKETLSLKRRSSSGLASLERKKETLAREIAHVGQLLNQYHAQKESIARLRTTTEERLKHEQDAQDSTKQQIDFGLPEEKAAAQERLRFIDEKITDLRAGMKEREAAEARLEKQIADLDKEKERLDSQLKRQSHVKPTLVEQLKSSEKAESVLRPRVQLLVKKEAQATKALQSIEKKLAESLAQKRKAKQKARRAKRKMPKRRAAKKTRTRTRKTSRRKTARKAKAQTRTKARAARRTKRRAAKRTTKNSRRSKSRRR